MTRRRTDWLSVIFVRWRRSASTFLFFVAADAYSRSFCEFFGWANANSFITEPNEDNIIQQLFWADKYRIAVCFSQFFIRRLFGHFKPRSLWRRWSLRPQTVLCDLVNDFLSLHSCLAAAHQTRSHSLTVRARLVYCCCAFTWCSFWKVIFHKVV